MQYIEFHLPFNKSVNFKGKHFSGLMIPVLAMETTSVRIASITAMYDTIETLTAVLTVQQHKELANRHNKQLC